MGKATDRFEDRSDELSAGRAPAAGNEDDARDEETWEWDGTSWKRVE